MSKPIHLGQAEQDAGDVGPGAILVATVALLLAIVVYAF